MEEPNVSGDQISEAAAPVSTVDLAPQAGERQEARQVPLDALQAERAERQKIQGEMQMLKEHLAIMQRQMQPSQQKDEIDRLADDDVLTVGEAKKFINKLDSQYQMTLKELRMTQKHKDYEHVVTKYLPEVLKQNPGLRSTLEQTQDYELAYYLAKSSDAYKAEHKRSEKNADAERIVQNARMAGSLSSVGQTSPVSQAKQYRNMSDADFRKEVQKNLGYY